MKVLVESSVLVVGLSEKADAFDRLPVRVKTVETGQEAVSSLRYEEYDAIISRWSLSDMKDGQLLKGAKLVKPDIAALAIVEAGDSRQEISARASGIPAVLTETCSDLMLVQTVSDMLKVPVLARQSADVV